MSLSRRDFLVRSSIAAAAGAAIAGTFVMPAPLSGADAPGAAAGAKPPVIRVGTCTMGLADAKQAGLEGVEVEVGRNGDDLAVADPAIRAKYKDQMQATGLPIVSLMGGQFNSFPLATDPRAPKWLEQAIDAAKDLGAKVILVAFFGKGDLLGADEKVKEADVDSAVQRLKVAAPRAKDAGIILAIENYLNGEQNARILERIDHPSVQVYFDVFNTGATKGHDIGKDIRLLGSRIAQVHFKNGPKYLDEGGKVNFEAAVTALRDVKYAGWIVLETSAPSKDRVADGKRNGAYVRKLLGRE